MKKCNMWDTIENTIKNRLTPKRRAREEVVCFTTCVDHRGSEISVWDTIMETVERMLRPRRRAEEEVTLITNCLEAVGMVPEGA